MCFVDFTKAFPYVNRTVLLDKLRSTGCSRRLVGMFSSTFEGNVMYIKTEQGVVGPVPCTRGLKEGAVESPIGWTILYSDAEIFIIQREQEIAAEEVWSWEGDWKK